MKSIRSVKWFTVICLLFITQNLQAQHYNFSAGVKLDASFIALTAQKRIAKRASIELMLPLTKNDVSCVLLGKKHNNVIGNKLNIYTGGGVHVGNDFKNGRIYGIDIIAGAEYSFFFIPYTIAFDFRPYVDFNAMTSPAYHLQSGLSIRYIIDKREPVSDWFKKIRGNKKWKDIEF